MAADPAKQPAPTVRRSLGITVGLCASPCVYAVCYDSPYTYPYLPIMAWGLAGLVASVIFGLVAGRLARWPRLGPAAIGLLASVAPGVYIGLEASTQVSPKAAATAMTIGLLSCLIIGSAAGLGAGIMAQREGRRTPWFGCAGLGLAIGASAGLYLSSIVFMPTVANAKLINLLVGGAIGLALGYAAARGGHNRPWLGRVSLGAAAGCCTGIWAYHVIYEVDGMFGQWSVWTVWPILGGAAGLAWAGRSGKGRLQPAAAGLAVGTCTGASFGLSACWSTECFQESSGISGISTWGLIGSLAGGVVGVVIGVLGYRTRLGSAALGLAIGALVGDSAFIFHTGTNYQGSLDASEFRGHVIVGVFGLVVGWLATDAGKRLAAFGLGFGGWVGAWAGAMAAYYAIVPGGVDLGGVVGMLVGGLIGLMISLRTIRAGRPRFGFTALSVAAGAFVGARLCDPGGDSAFHGILGMVIGGGLGLILRLRGERAFIASVPGLAAGAVIGAWTGVAVLALFPVPASPNTTNLICMTAGGLMGLIYVHGSRLMMAGRMLALPGPPLRQVNPTPWQDARLDQLTSLSRRLASLAAAHIAGTSETIHKRYAEEFDGNLRMITGRFAPLKRLRCAISILIGALTMRIENEDDDDNV